MSDYRKMIVDAMVRAGTYSPLLDATIEVLAGILCRLEQARGDIERLGINLEVISREGKVRYVLNPACAVEGKAWSEARKYLDVLHLTLGQVKASASETDGGCSGLESLESAVNGVKGKVYRR